MLVGREVRFSFEKTSLPSSNILVFDSRSEYACAVLLEKYLPGWEAQTRSTFQIPIDNKRVDFRVGDTFVEFHPLKLGHKRRSPLFQEIEAHAKTLYHDKRRALLDQNGYQNYPLIVAYNEREFFVKVIKEFGTGYPRESVFLDEFQKLRFLLDKS